MSTKTSITNDETLTEPLILIEGDQAPIDVIISGIKSTLTSPTNTFYKMNGGTDLSSTYLTGSTTASGIESITTKSMTGLKQGEWMLCVSATVDGYVQMVARIPLIVKRANQE